MDNDETSKMDNDHTMGHSIESDQAVCIPATSKFHGS